MSPTQAASVKVVVFSPYYPPAYRAGGPVKSVSELVRSPANPYPTLVVSRNWDLGEPDRLRTEANVWLDTGGERLWAFDRGLLAYVRSLEAVARQAPQLVYVNSLFDPWTGAFPALLWRVFGSRKSQLVVAPRGQTSAVPLAKSARRKRLVLPCWRWIVMHDRAIVHAASREEKRDIEGVLGNVRIVVRPNEVGPLLPLLPTVVRSATIHAVFLGRIVPIKGLLELLESLRDATCSLTLDVIGPTEDEPYLGRCLSAAAELPTSVTVNFMGSVESDDVRRQLAGYDVMLNPTQSESFGQAIGESLSVGTPVAVADVTPWTSWIEGASGGRIVRGWEWAKLVDSLSQLGANDWDELRRGARKAYEKWWQEAQGRPHLFQLVSDQHQP